MAEMTMLEKMARAWWEAREATMPERCRQKWEDGTPLARETMIGQCRAALEAIREPSEAMQAAIFEDRDGFVHPIDIEKSWRVGIDCILKGKA